MINLSKRLKTAASFVLKEKISGVIDVGCDHALLDIYLIQNNENLKIIASDNKNKPLENAKKNITKYSFLDKIEIIKKDGIKDIPNYIDTIVISGMGADTIIEILKDGIEELSHVNRLIISSNNKYEMIRKEISLLGFKIVDEKIVYEEEKYYIVMEFKKGKSSYNEKELLIGPSLLKNKDDIFYEYYNYVLNKKEEVYNILPENHKNIDKLKKEIDYLKEEL